MNGNKGMPSFAYERQASKKKKRRKSKLNKIPTIQEIRGRNAGSLSRSLDAAFGRVEAALPWGEMVWVRQHHRGR